jgi:hypothetical protein
MKKIRRDAKRVGHGKMLCPFCKVIQQINHQNDKGEIYLQCKHKRTPGLLPSHSPGSTNEFDVSAESLINALSKTDAQKILRQEADTVQQEEAEQNEQNEQNEQMATPNEQNEQAEVVFDEAVSDEWQDATQAEAVSEWKEGLKWE